MKSISLLDKNNLITFKEFDILTDVEKFQILKLYWECEKLVFCAIYEKEKDHKDYITFSSVKLVNGREVNNVFTNKIIEQIKFGKHRNKIKKVFEDGKRYIFSVDINKAKDINIRRDNPIVVNQMSIVELSDINSLEEIIESEFYSKHKAIIDDIENTFKNKYFSVCTGDDLKELISEYMLEIESKKTALETDIKSYNAKLENIVMQHDVCCKNIKALKENIEEKEANLSEIEKQFDYYKEIGILDDESEKMLDDIDIEKPRRIKEISKVVSHVQKYLKNRKEKPLIYSEYVLEQFLIGIVSNQLIILGGGPGTGKTSLVEGFADALSIKCKIISIKPNWHTADDLFGYYNPLDKLYLGTDFVDAILEASENEDELYFICLDEMNIAFVEEYFADFLSAMYSNDKEIRLYSYDIYETQKKFLKEIFEIYKNKSNQEIKDKMELETLVQRYKNMNKYNPILKIPKNLKIIGTINKDETTKDLSPKVIDRSIIINIKSDSSILDTLLDDKIEKPLKRRCIFLEDFNLIQKINKPKTIHKFREILAYLYEHSIEINLRFIDVASVMLTIDYVGDKWAIDYIIATKILPRINIIDNDEFVEGLHKFIADKKISKAIYGEMKKFYEKEGVFTYWR